MAFCRAGGAPRVLCHIRGLGRSWRVWRTVSNPLVGPGIGKPRGCGVCCESTFAYRWACSAGSRYLARCGRVSGPKQARFHIGHTVSPGDSQSECVTGRLLLVGDLTIVLPLDYLTSGAAPRGAGPGSTGRREPNSPAPPAMACTCTPGRVGRRRPHLGGCGETGRFGTWVLTSAPGAAVRRLPTSAECRIASTPRGGPGHVS